ncbi:hypothetical protein [Desulfurivibrio sp. C05AmB]|jgi:hypothetical protein|uniref:zinc ribbon-containing (seleno)protein DG n=1 Tax=Desulfurivibrio sp. C05AmB TaxID=3374371 RepID=UPI00376F3D02
MYDLMLKYCPVCGGEFRAEIQTCGICEVVLLSGGEMQNRVSEQAARRLGRAGALTGGEDMVLIQRGPLGDLRHLEALLKEERIACRITADEKSCSKSCCPSSFLLEVSRDDAPDAARIVEQEYRRMTRLDDHQMVAGDAVFNPEAEENICPACGYRFPSTSSECPDCGLNFG